MTTPLRLTLRAQGKPLPGLCTLTGPVRAWWGERERGWGGGVVSVVRSPNYMLDLFISSFVFIKTYLRMKVFLGS